MPYSLSEAAAACGVNRSTLLRAVKSGKISGTRDEAGTWHVEAAELHRVFPPAASAQAADAPLPQSAEADALRDALIAQLREALCDMRQQRGDAQAERDKWREAFENQQRLALPAPSAPAAGRSGAPPHEPHWWSRWLSKLPRGVNSKSGREPSEPASGAKSTDLRPAPIRAGDPGSPGDPLRELMLADLERSLSVVARGRDKATFRS